MSTALHKICRFLPLNPLTIQSKLMLQYTNIQKEVYVAKFEFNKERFCEHQTRLLILYIKVSRSYIKLTTLPPNNNQNCYK